MRRLGFDEAREAATFVSRTVPDFPSVAVVLGSGLGGLADALDTRSTIPYAEIPHMPRPSVEGHAGLLHEGRLSGSPVALLQGRFHYYEGRSLDEVVFPVRLMRALGVRTLILTAATGGLRESLDPGDLVCLSDHLNLIGPNPLRGPNDDRLGPRFPDMTEVYSPRLRLLAKQESDRLRIPLSEGIYAAVSGPSFETPAEVRMLRALGADVVGMSTVPEAIAARHSGLDVLAFALVTNPAAGMTGSAINHKDVLEAGRIAGASLAKLIAAVLPRI
jgi:purine-nucleoside phosphorylase